MKISYFEGSAYPELEFEGDAGGYEEISSVAASGGSLDVYPAFTSGLRPDERLIRTLDVKHTQTEKAFVSVVGNKLVIEGDSPSLKAFSFLLKDYGENAETGYHQDIYFYEGHDFLREGSWIMTLEQI